MVTYAGKMMVCLIILHFGSEGISTVSFPEQGAPPTKVFSFGDVQQRWQIFPFVTLLGSVLEALPASIRKPYTFHVSKPHRRAFVALRDHRACLTFLNAVVFPLGM